ncbi:hypothetical protein BD311DRAFT_805309 [Dichomitus squalens]|uniref:Uncharacterized protein n=1 Tax=Dichomitus squalens TaxID=114155 RepID=A0A4Q9MT04_9APHY|nr:hypothetical protein BD311DRAFT_805309 [Dichomitus squalens]
MELESVTGHSQDYHNDYCDHKGLDTDLSRTSSRASLQDSQSSEHIEFPQHISPPPSDEHAQNICDERRYRILLQHEFHPLHTRRYSSPLRSGHKAANRFTESMVYRYMEDPVTSKKWFKANTDNVLAIYEAEHRITKEDLYLVIGTLKAQDYALFISHEHPNGQVNFNVFSATRNGCP